MVMDVSPVITRPHNCGSPGCSRRGETEYVSQRHVIEPHHCGSPGCTRRGEPEMVKKDTVLPKPRFGEPNIKNYKIEKCKVVGDFTIVQARYSDCENYEGLKVLVLQGDQTLNLLNRTELDPHFTMSSELVSRFVPTHEGWIMAEAFAETWSRIKSGR